MSGASCAPRWAGSEAVDRDTYSAGLEDATPLAFRGTSPDAMVDAVLKRELETGIDHRAGGADSLRHLNTHSVAREERIGGEVAADSGVHPVSCGFHVAQCRERGEKAL